MIFLFPHSQKIYSYLVPIPKDAAATAPPSILFKQRSVPFWFSQRIWQMDSPIPKWSLLFSSSLKYVSDAIRRALGENPLPSSFT